MVRHKFLTFISLYKLGLISFKHIYLGSISSFLSLINPVLTRFQVIFSHYVPQKPLYFVSIKLSNCSNFPVRKYTRGQQRNVPSNKFHTQALVQHILGFSGTFLLFEIKPTLSITFGFQCRFPVLKQFPDIKISAVILLSTTIKSLFGFILLLTNQSYI